MQTRTRVPVADPSREIRMLRDRMDEAYRRVLSSGSYILGPEHDQFESEFARYCGVEHCVAVASGTDALSLALVAVGCGSGDEVITVANAGAYATLAALDTGARVALADVDPATLTISPESVAEALSPRTRAVIVTHLFGKLADVEGVRAVLAGRDVTIIEDCAQSHGATRHGRKAGSLGDLATFSFYPTKNLGAVGDGGALTTNDPNLAGALRELRQYGWTERYRIGRRGGRNSRLDELQAAFLRIKLTMLDEFNTARRAVASRYRIAARGTAVSLVHEPKEDFVAHLVVARHPDREGVRGRLAERGVATAVHYPLADYEQPGLSEVEWGSTSLSHTIAAQREIFTLPCFPGITDDEIGQVCEALSSIR